MIANAAREGTESRLTVSDGSKSRLIRAFTELHRHSTVINLYSEDPQTPPLASTVCTGIPSDVFMG